MDGKEKKRKDKKLTITDSSPQLIVVIAVSSNANQIKVVRVGSLGDGINSNIFSNLILCCIKVCRKIQNWGSHVAAEGDVENSNRDI